MKKNIDNAKLSGEATVTLDAISTPIVGSNDRRPWDPDGVGITKRSKRLLMARQRFTNQVKFDHPEWSDQQVRNEVNEMLKEWESMAPGIVKQYELLEPTCVAPRRDRVDSRVEVAAMRGTQQIQNLEAHLRSTPSVKDGAVRTAIAVLEHSIFSSLVPEIKESREAFFGSDALIDWAYGDPTIGSTITSAAGIGNAVHALLDDPQNDPKMLVQLNLEVIQELAKNHERIGRYCLIDGTAIPSFTRQVGTCSDEEELLINRGTSSTFIKHEQKGGTVKKWRGYEMLTITDMKSTLPLAWILISAQPTAFEVQQVMDLLFDMWPECPMKYLVGDSEFDSNEIMQMLHEDYGVIGVFDLRDQMRAGIAAITDVGQPKCVRCKKPMKLTHREKFWTIDDRLAANKPRRERISLKNARLRWECEHGCLHPTKSTPKKPVPLKLQTRPRDYWRVFTMLPHAGNSKWAHLRSALMYRRNSIKAVFSALKREKIGLIGSGKSRWIRTQREMEWIVGGSLFTQTLRRQVQLSGKYDDALADGGQFLKA
ncbi:MAG: hypothetical protein WAP35_08655 [Solirubrobacterales bacterium]